MHTEQIITSKDHSTTTVEEVYDETPVKAVEIELPNAKKAMAYQQSMLGKELGPYDMKTNSCVDHVAEVLRQGGVEVPKSALGQHKFLKGKGF